MVVSFQTGFEFQTLYGQSECLDPTWCPLDAPRKQQLEGRVNVGPETEVIYHTIQTIKILRIWSQTRIVYYTYVVYCMYHRYVPFYTYLILFNYS